MKRQESLSERELEMLSAYLDDALAPKDKQRFEERLARSLSLQKTMKEYTQLKVALRNLPQQPAPRNFTLSPEQARAHKPAPKLYPAFSYVALTAVLLLALVFSTEFFFNQFSTPMMAQIESPTMEAGASAIKSTEAPQPTPMIFTWNSSGGMAGGAGGSGLGGGSTFTITSINEKTQAGGNGEAGGGIETPTEEAEIMSLPPGMGTGGGGGGEEVTPVPEATPVPTEVEPRALSATSEGTTIEPLILGIQQDKAGQVITASPQFPEETTPQEEPTRSWTKLVADDIKLILAGVAALFGILALVFYIKR